MDRQEHKKHDLKDRSDIEALVVLFYEQAIVSNVIGQFFTEVVILNFEHHIPLICDFWEGVLLGVMKYKGNPMVKHIALSRKHKIDPVHFEEWLQLWERAVRSLFEGPTADEAIYKANQIAELMQHKIKMAGP